MAITHVKIHPAIGVARVGNSPNEWFVGPEYPGQKLSPEGGFKDGSCRVKRQAVRFRLFAYHDDGPPTLLTAADGAITWKVRIVNRKSPGTTIDSTERTLSAPNVSKQLHGQATVFGETHEVLLGEARTEDSGHLLVLAGPGKAGHHSRAGGPPIGWFDDVGDGPVTASFTLRGGRKLTATGGAWVVTAPPRFAPHVESAITLHDYLFDFAVSQTWLSAAPEPSYTAHIQPILQRARDVRWLRESGGEHLWPDPVVDEALRHRIFARLGNPAGGGGDMPLLPGGAKLTKVQYGWMKRWSEGEFVNDWTGDATPSSEITPEGLDRAALEACVGPPFQPGIEVGGTVLQSGLLGVLIGEADPLRVDHEKTFPGQLTSGLNVPWHTDLFNCGGYWPAASPGSVLLAGTSTRADWLRDVGPIDRFVDSWPLVGFLVKELDGTRQVEVERCSPPPKLDHSDWLAIVTILFGVIQDGGGAVVVNGVPIPVGPWDPLKRLAREGRDALRGLALAELAQSLEDSDARKQASTAALHAVRDSVARLLSRQR